MVTRLNAKEALSNFYLELPEFTQKVGKEISPTQTLLSALTTFVSESFASPKSKVVFGS